MVSKTKRRRCRRSDGKDEEVTGMTENEVERNSRTGMYKNLKRLFILLFEVFLGPLSLSFVFCCLGPVGVFVVVVVA